VGKESHAGKVAARPSETSDQSALDRVHPRRKTIGIEEVASFAASAEEPPPLV
jgi:hypothetical protein